MLNEFVIEGLSENAYTKFKVRLLKSMLNEFVIEGLSEKTVEIGSMIFPLLSTAKIKYISYNNWVFYHIYKT